MDVALVVGDKNPDNHDTVSIHILVHLLGNEEGFLNVVNPGVISQEFGCSCIHFCFLDLCTFVVLSSDAWCQ